MMNTKLIRVFSIVLVSVAIIMILGSLYPLLAQVVTPAAAPQGDPCPGGEPCDPDVPITGIEWLLVTGGLFGARKIYKSLRRNN